MKYAAGRILIILTGLLLVPCIGGCTNSGDDIKQPETTTADSVSALDGYTIDNAGCFDIGSSYYSTRETGIAVTVENTAVNTVKSELFGDNLAWRGNGYGVWDSASDSLNNTLVEAIRKCGVTALRYPGGIEGDYFHWFETVGSDRKLQVDPFSSDYPTYAGKNGVSYYPSFGFDEFMSLCKASGVNAVVQLNAGNGTPGEAADWVSYCIEKGYNISSYAIGNEVNMAAEKVDGITVTKTPEEYIEFAEAVFDALGDTADDIEIGVIGLLPNHALNKYPDWDRSILRALGDRIDFIDCHLGYAPYFTSAKNTDEEIFRSYMASATYIERLINKTLGEIDDYAGDNAENITLQITEYGPMGTYYNGTVGSVFLASIIQVMADEPRISAADHLPMLNHPYAANLIGYYVSSDGTEYCWDNICTYIFRWYSEQAGRNVLKTEVASPVFDAKAIGLIPYVPDAESADAAVYTDADGKSGTIFIINRDTEENMTFDITLPFEYIKITGVSEIWSSDPTAANTWNDQFRVLPKSYSLKDSKAYTGTISVTTKPISVVRMDFEVIG